MTLTRIQFRARLLLAVALCLAPAWASAAEKPTLHVLAVGVSQYEKTEANVPGPDKGARQVAALFAAQEGKLYERVEVVTLVNEQATLKAIRSQVGRLQEQLAAGDNVVVYLCGHGAMVFGEWYFMPYNALFVGMIQALPGRELTERLSGLQGKATLIVDSCHSGGLLDLGAMEMIGGTNLAVFCSSRYNEVSRVDGAAGVGVYTLAVLEALRGEADANGDGEVTVTEVEAYVAMRVEVLVKKMPLSFKQRMALTMQNIKLTQTPKMSRPRSIRGDTALVRVTTAEVARAK